MRSIAFILCFAALAIPAPAANLPPTNLSPDAAPATRPSSLNHPTTAPSSDSIHDLKVAAEAAQHALAQAQAAVVAQLQQNPDYQQAASDLQAAQAAVDNSSPDDPDRATAAANKLAAQNRLDSLQNDAFANDPATVAARRQAQNASAQYQAAQKQWQADQAAAAANQRKFAPASTFESRLTGQQGHPRNPTAAQRAKLAQARGIDSKIDAFAAAHNLPPDMTAAMHEGRAVIGLPEEALPIFMHVKLSAAAPATRPTSAAPHAKQFIASALDYQPPAPPQDSTSIFSDGSAASVSSDGSAAIPDSTLMPWQITAQDGKVTKVVNP